MKALVYVNDKISEEAKRRPAAVLFGMGRSIAIHVLSEGKPERRVQLRLEDKTFVEAWAEYRAMQSAEVPISCVSEGADLDDAARKMLVALGVLTDQSPSQSRDSREPSSEGGSSGLV